MKCLSGGMGRGRRYKRRLRVHRVAAANHRIRRPGRRGIRSIRRRDPGIRESSRAHRLKRMELRSCRGDPSRPASPPLHPSPSRYFHGVIDVVLSTLEFYLFYGRRRVELLIVIVISNFMKLIQRLAIVILRDELKS